MVEILFLLVFAGVLIMTGVSVLGMVIAMAAGFAVMAFAGLIGVVIKLLPWIILIAIGVWLYRGSRRGNPYRKRY
ncbi:MULTISPECIES: envelope stress response protein PspG [unclassified Photobacterium]|uniref:envelope stress response protein PspG n=1 Tax=unclassified Photobacterium TaxID=2628852 RepID=UPI001B8B2A1A|nr:MULTISPECIES: envelope stress response protein PspG [unclassified Photobacterium]MDO6708795.1 envelope stress response protein PspG [Photobacterium sp. 1_MG-2023]QUJ67749.1 envelope stress response protein PspG [Photobacterium sp. GJ3]